MPRFVAQNRKKRIKDCWAGWFPPAAANPDVPLKNLPPGDEGEGDEGEEMGTGTGTGREEGMRGMRGMMEGMKGGRIREGGRRGGWSSCWRGGSGGEEVMSEGVEWCFFFSPGLLVRLSAPIFRGLPLFLQYLPIHLTVTLALTASRTVSEAPIRRPRNGIAEDTSEQ